MRQTPLATVLRPQTLAEIVGQKHLVADKQGLIWKLINKKFLPSLILHGLPGTGKTSLAYVIAQEMGYQVACFNAAIDKKSQLADIINQAPKGQQMLLIVEEIHRMNRDRQDLLLQYIEHGAFILIACTSENPNFVVNPALRSRCLLVATKPISGNEMFVGLQKMIVNRCEITVNIEDEALNLICALANGDLRTAINILELLQTLYPHQKVGKDNIKAIMPEANLWNFKAGNEHHDLKSALQKAIRGSDADAAVYYLARMLASGDYEALLRRLIITAYEDIGLANPALCFRVQGAASAFREIGMPEGMIVLGLIVVEMALSAKSNSANQAVQKAYQDVIAGKAYQIPRHLTKLGTSDYLYPPSFHNSYVPQKYLPNELINVKYYQPRTDNIYEKKLFALYEQFIKEASSA